MRRRRWSVIAVVTVVALMAGGVAGAHHFGMGGLFTQAADSGSLTRAEGRLWDVDDTGWVQTGDWVLACRTAGCVEDPTNIRFDFGHIMVFPDGASSHTHIYSDFVASTATAGPDSISITGTIVGSGNVGPSDITIELIGISGGGGEFWLELPGNAHVQGRLGGVIINSQ